MKQQTKFKQTEIGMIPEDWAFEELGKHAKIVTGQSPESKYYNSLREGTLFLQGIRTFGELYPHYDTWTNKITKLAKKNSILLSVRAPVGEVNIADQDICIGRGLMSIEGKNNKFIFYLFKAFKDYVISKETGTVYGSVTREDITRLPFPFPKDIEQSSIASILSSLDAKIELNNQMNKTLEAVGQALFKRWFVDEAEDEWKEGKLGDYVKSISGCSYTSDGLETSENALVTLKSIGVNGFKQEGFKEYIGDYKSEQVVEEGDIVVAHTDLTQNRIILGKPVIVRDFGKYKKMIASMDLSIVKPLKLINKPYLYYLLSTDSFHNHAQGYSNGTTVIHLSRRAIPEFEFRIPPKELLDKFKQMSDNLFNQMRMNDLQNQSLTQIRDSLLPKLMSGKIRVNVK